MSTTDIILDWRLRLHHGAALRVLAHTPVKGILLDYGGTIDSRARHWSAIIRDAWQAEGIEIDGKLFWEAYVHAERALDGTEIILPEDTFLDVMGKKITLQRDYMAGSAAMDDSATMDGQCPAASPAKGFIRSIDDRTVENVAARCYHEARECVDEARPLLEALAEKYPLGIVSNFYGNLRAVLADMGIAHLYNSVTDSGNESLRKPDPHLFSLALRQLNDATGLGLTPTQVLVAGDSLGNDIIPARSLGFMTLRITE